MQPPLRAVRRLLALAAAAVPLQGAAAVPDPSVLRAAAVAPAALPSRAALAGYFAAGPRTLDLFCAPERRCQPARQKRELYSLFFRGSFARPPLPAAPPPGSLAPGTGTGTGGRAGAVAGAGATAPVVDAPDAGARIATAGNAAVSAAAVNEVALGTRPPDIPVADDVDAAYAAQAAAYFTEPGYACRRPLTARVLETLWQLPARDDACAPTVPFLVGGDEGRPEVRAIAPARVAAVHLLFAGETGNSFSRFGHVGLRLLVCAPGREAVDARCDEDLDDHLALGFRAAVDELDLSMWKGLTGGYALRLFADPFMAIYDDYTVREFRALSSLPLTLAPAERELLVRALAEVHWAYGTDYRFFSHNCASELSWLLRVVGRVAGAEPPWLAGDNVRPDRLFRRALASPAFARARLDDLAQAERDGFFFPNSAPYFQLALDTVARRADAAGARLPVRDFQSFRALDAETRRRDYYAPALAPAALPAAPAEDQAERARAAHAAVVLEAWMERRSRRQLLAVLAQHYLELSTALLARTDFFTPAERARLSRCLEGLAQPLVLGRLDGVPAAPGVPDAGCDLGGADMQASLERLFRLAPPPRHEERQIAELRTTVATVDWLMPHTGLKLPSTPRPDGERP